MKTRALLLAALLAPLAASATEILPGAQSNVSLNLTRHASEPVSLTDLENPGTKIVKHSYTSKDLLTELLDEGLLGESETSIANWKLVIVDRTPLAEHEENTLVFYAVKKGVTPIQIPGSRLNLNASTEVGADGHTYKKVAGEYVYQKSTFKALVSLSGHAALEAEYDYNFSLHALASGSDAISVRKIKVDLVTETFDYDLLGAVTFKPVLGTYTDNEAEGEQTPVEGQVTFSAFTALDISGYPHAN